MKYGYVSSFFPFFYIFLFVKLILITKMHACDVMGARACGEKPDKELRESDPIKYCVASRVYFECVHKKYRGCENKEKYEIAMESMLKGIRKRVDDLLGFCSDKIEDYKFNIVWESAKKPEAADSVRAGGSLSNSLVKNDNLGSSASHSLLSHDACQTKAISSFCQPLAITVKFNPSWNAVNKRSWCQQATVYFRCLKDRLDKCPQEDALSQLHQLEHYISSQVNFHCPGGVDGCARNPTDARCKLGVHQLNSSSSTFCLACFVVQSVLHILLLF